MRTLTLTPVPGRPGRYLIDCPDVCTSLGIAQMVAAGWKSSAAGPVSPSLVDLVDTIAQRYGIEEYLLDTSRVEVSR
jgi:hypothetical protein